MSTLIRQRALQTWVLSICIIAVLLSLNFFTLKQCILFYIHPHSFGFAIWYNLSAFYFYANSYLFYLVLLLKITLFNVVHCDGKNLTRLWWRCYDLRVEKVRAHADFWENLWAKAGPNRASIDSSEKKDYVGLPTNSFIGQGCTCDFLWKFRASMRRTREDTRGAP